MYILKRGGLRECILSSHYIQLVSQQGGVDIAVAASAPDGLRASSYRESVFLLAVCPPDHHDEANWHNEIKNAADGVAVPEFFGLSVDLGLTRRFGRRAQTLMAKQNGKRFTIGSRQIVWQTAHSPGVLKRRMHIVAREIIVYRWARELRPLNVLDEESEYRREEDCREDSRSEKRLKGHEKPCRLEEIGEGHARCENQLMTIHRFVWAAA